MRVNASLSPNERGILLLTIIKKRKTVAKKYIGMRRKSRLSASADHDKEALYKIVKENAKIST